MCPAGGPCVVPRAVRGLECTFPYRVVNAGRGASSADRQRGRTVTTYRRLNGRYVADLPESCETKPQQCCPSDKMSDNDPEDHDDPLSTRRYIVMVGLWTVVGILMLICYTKLNYWWFSP